MSLDVAGLRKVILQRRADRGKVREEKEKLKEKDRQEKERRERDKNDKQEREEKRKKLDNQAGLRFGVTLSQLN